MHAASYFLIVCGSGYILVYTTVLSLGDVSMYDKILSQRIVKTNYNHPNCLLFYHRKI